jgi:hypothetical protein
MPSTLSGHIQTLKEKPHHVRHGIAIGTAGAVSGVVAIAWVAAIMSSGALSLRPTQIAQNDGASLGSALEGEKTNFSELLGAAGAALGATSSPASLTIVDAGSSSSLERKPAIANDTAQTVIHF